MRRKPGGAMNLATFRTFHAGFECGIGDAISGIPGAMTRNPNRWWRFRLRRVWREGYAIGRRRVNDGVYVYLIPSGKPPTQDFSCIVTKEPILLSGKVGIG